MKRVSQIVSLIRSIGETLRVRASARRLRISAVAALLAVPLAGPLAAQITEASRGPSPVSLDREQEEFLRYLQSVGRVPFYPWSIRGFSPREVDRLVPADPVDPWLERLPSEVRIRGGRWAVLATEGGMVYNSAFPYGFNDGPVWAGRGLTTALRTGVGARYGPISLTFAPVLFWSQNREFKLTPNGQPGPLAFADPNHPTSIDLPQRFGDEPYGRVEPGQSSLRLDLPLLAVGVSTANQYWGPATTHPLILGDNAGGFPHLFLGTGGPLGVGLGQIHGRVVWGRLDQSDYSAADADERHRFMSGVVGVFMPRGIPGLELGGARFFHSRWPRGGPSAADLGQPFGGLLKAALPKEVAGTDIGSDNQLASVFARWVLAGSGMDLYGEYAREDHSYDLRDLVLQPDHNSAYMVGFRKAWMPGEERLVALRGEVLNSRISHLETVRPQTYIYRHFAMRQGHTQRGQLLGSAAGFAGGGSVVALDYYDPAGRWTFEWNRFVRRPPRAEQAGGAYGNGALHSLSVEHLAVRGRWAWTAALGAVRELAPGGVGGGRGGFNAELKLRLLP